MVASEDNRFSGGVRQPPPLQSIARFQRTVGNRATQKILGVGDAAKAVLPANPAPGRSLWRRLLDRLRK